MKLRISPMLGLERFGTAAATIAGIELQRRIYKGRFNPSMGCTSKMDVRSLSGMRCWRRGKAHTVGSLRWFRLYLHQNPRRRRCSRRAGCSLPPTGCSAMACSQAAASQRDGRYLTADTDPVGAIAAASAVRTCASLKCQHIIDKPA